MTVYCNASSDALLQGEFGVAASMGGSYTSGSQGDPDLARQDGPCRDAADPRAGG